MMVLSLTPSRMGIITSRRVWSQLSEATLNSAGISLGSVAGGAWATRPAASSTAITPWVRRNAMTASCRPGGGRALARGR